jgi:hypothetical protein
MHISDEHCSLSCRFIVAMGIFSVVLAAAAATAIARAAPGEKNTENGPN